MRKRRAQAVVWAQTEMTLWLAASTAGWNGCPGGLQMVGDSQQSLRAETTLYAQDASYLPAGSSMLMP